ncbi:vWA domain-containing protein [Roseicyclus mahoneyensis]|uniref:von Willebrand factor type A domain-containing protein n=1 Tax=Roseicyclus mahoneyensis TaxID=164332 RepID=A0A316GPI7_9RHOB|nr:VWA domain-containing protein [Roseicyclus mahoneyensis]PWK62935.1 von Willebrand factor type A domain-containing protein [Roseicyclus mahoneyensis]
MRRIFRTWLWLATAFLLATAPVRAQEQPNLIIVLDGSGSMWGQVDGRTKIDLAREALSQVLSEATAEMQIGMLAYGHRVRGQCSDIELMVPTGPAGASVPAILGAAGRISPLGMTPLTESVLQAAQQLRFSEQAATVVLLTDGVETCGGDPCALGRMLESQGIDFTAHVVGFDMTDAEQRTVACLADETGGLFIAANDADDLARALRETIISAPLPDPGPILRPVSLTLRDTAGGAPINGRQIDLFVEPQTPGGTAPEGLRVTQDQPVTATGQFLPGLYTAYIRRATAGSTPVSLQVTLEVPEGTGPHAIDLVIGARLRLTAMAHAGLPMPPGGGNLPFAAYGSSAGRAHFVVHPVIDGAIDTSVDYGGWNSLDVALPPGDYFIRGGLSRSFSRERLVRVLPGEITEYVFDFEAARVFVDIRDAQGFPVDRLSTYFYDGPGGTDFLNGGGRSAEGLLPFYLPVGTWRVDTGATGGGQRRAQAVFDVTRPGEDITLSLREGARANDADLARLSPGVRPGCIANLGGEYGCLVEAVSPADFLRLDGIDPASAEGQAALALSFTGTWQTSSGPVALVQDGRRVWGDVPDGVLTGEVAADGLTLRGVWRNGLVELRLSTDGQSMAGRWGRGLDPNLGNTAITGRRLSAGTPPLARATGTEMDLPEAYRNAASPGFEAFMAPARAPAMAPTTPASDPSFAGVWSSSHQTLTLHQQGRRVWGERARGVLEGEVSADGATLRGTWTTGGDWGTFEFVLDAQRQAFTGGWGRGADPDLRGGSWTGTRQTYLPAPLSGPEATAMARPPGASGPDFDGFMQAVRDADPTPAPTPPAIEPPAPMPTPGLVAGPDLNPGFAPILRRDFADATGQSVISIAFSAVQQGGDTGSYAEGFAWLRADWCGPTCPEEILRVGGRYRDDVPNAYVRLDREGLFPAYSAAIGQLVFEVTPTGLTIHGIDEIYSDGAQLGLNRELIARTFGSFSPVAQVPPGMTGWPALPGGAGGVLIDPAPMPVADPVTIGTIDVLPIGVFASVIVPESVPLGLAFDSLFTDSAVQAELAAACAENPTVIYPDGLSAARSLDPAGAARGGSPYETTFHERCEQSGPILSCIAYDGPPETAQEVDRYIMPVTSGPRGSFALSFEGERYLHRACFGPDGFQSASQMAPDGVPMWQHVVARADGGPGLTITPDGQFIGTEAGGTPGPAPVPAPAPGPAPAPMSGTDFTAAAGIWSPEAPTAEHAASCYDAPAVLHPDGRMFVFSEGLDAAGLPLPDTDYLSCTSMQDCRVVTREGFPAPSMQGVVLSLDLRAPDTLAVCATGQGCRTLLRCDPMEWSAREQASGLADRWMERVMSR